MLLRRREQFAAGQQSAIFVLEIGGQYAFAHAVLDLLPGPEASAVKLGLARSHGSVVDRGEGPYKLSLATALEDIVGEGLRRVVGHA